MKLTMVKLFRSCHEPRRNLPRLCHRWPVATDDPVPVRFAAALAHVPGLAALVPGGSRGRGAAWPRSDCDLRMGEVAICRSLLDPQGAVAALARRTGRWTRLRSVAEGLRALL